LITRHVHKEFYTSGRDIHDRLWGVYSLLLQTDARPRNCIRISSVRFDGIDSGHADWSVIGASQGVRVDLQLEPVGSAPEVADSTELLALVRYDNNSSPLLVVPAS
jgi:hypothetical protein